jgi:hypothetical protein
MSELKEFEKMLKICRKYGVLKLNFDGIKVKFEKMPENHNLIRDEIDVQESQPAEMTPDEMIYWAVQGQ